VSFYAYAGGNPITFGDPLGLWSISVSAYEGAGGSITVGNDDGHWFYTARVGLGFGGGIHYEPNGGVPNGTEETGECSGAVLSASVKADAGFSALFNGAIEAGAERNYASQESNCFFEKSLSFGPEIELRDLILDAALNWHAEVSIGGQVTLYKSTF
jgi:hypothetical protein